MQQQQNQLERFRELKRLKEKEEEEKLLKKQEAVLEAMKAQENQRQQQENLRLQNEKEMQLQQQRLQQQQLHQQLLQARYQQQQQQEKLRQQQQQEQQHQMLLEEKEKEKQQLQQQKQQQLLLERQEQQQLLKQQQEKQNLEQQQQQQRYQNVTSDVHSTSVLPIRSPQTNAISTQTSPTPMMISESTASPTAHSSREAQSNSDMQSVPTASGSNPKFELCKVCEQNMARYKYYTVLSCNQCKKIFGRHHAQNHCTKCTECENGDSQCDITKQRPRMKCTSCWLAKCVKEGMKYKNL